MLLLRRATTARRHVKNRKSVSPTATGPGGSGRSIPTWCSDVDRECHFCTAVQTCVQDSALQQQRESARIRSALTVFGGTAFRCGYYRASKAVILARVIAASSRPRAGRQ